MLGETVTLATFGITAIFLGIEAKSRLGEILGVVGKWVIFTGIGLNSFISITGVVKTLVELVRKYRQIIAINESLHLASNSG